MNGGQDLGGMHGFGPVRPERGEPIFHAEWEQRVLALTLAMGATGAWNIDASRAARESMPPGRYLTSSYYEIWLAGLERLLAEHDLVTADERRAGRALAAPRPVARTLAAAHVPAVLGRGGPADREPPRPARFRSGDAVRTRNLQPQTHTRLPRYARGRSGVITTVHGCHVFPDHHALGLGEDPQWLYSVRFDGRELWGEDADPTLSVSIDAFEPYLEPAP